MVLAALTACAGEAPPPSPPPVPPQDGSLAACLWTLDQQHVRYDRVRDWGRPGRCGIQGAIRLRRDDVAWSRPLLMTCHLAATLDAYELRVVQPAAWRYFRQRVRRIANVGTYNCRDERSSRRRRRLSQHAFGKAIDITGFELEDGSVISVRRDWFVPGDKAAFLHDVAKGACGLFSVVLTPDYNVFHRGHMHLDVGPYRLCGL